MACHFGSTSQLPHELWSLLEVYTFGPAGWRGERATTKAGGSAMSSCPSANRASWRTGDNLQDHRSIMWLRMALYNTLYFNQKKCSPASNMEVYNRNDPCPYDRCPSLNSTKGPKRFNAASPALKRLGKSCLAAIGQRASSVEWMGCLTI